MLSFAVALSAVLIFNPAHAQYTPPSDECRRFEQIRSLGGDLDKSDQPALSALLDVVPRTCDSLRQRIDRELASINNQPEWRIEDPKGAIVPAEAPPPPHWASDPETWPASITTEMLLQRPSEWQIFDLHPQRARERGRVGAVIMEGRARRDGTFVWRIIDTSPTGWGFEYAALRVGALYRAPATFADGRTTEGAPFLTVVAFTAPPPRPRVQY
jgi:hypothetical protein